MPVINQYDMSRLYTAVLLSLFDEIQINRRDVLNPYTVPLTYESKSRLYKRLYSDASKADSLMYSRNLPAMTLKLNNIDFDIQRQTNRMLRKKEVQVGGTTAILNWNDTSVILSYTLTLVGKSLTEMTNIAEYIMSTFKNQLYYVNVNTPLYTDSVATPIIMNTTTVTIDSNENEYSDDRLLECEFDISVKGILHNNVTTTSPLITQVQLNAYMDLALNAVVQQYNVTV